MTPPRPASPPELTDSGGAPANAEAPFDLVRSKTLLTPLIFASPHSGRLYPETLMGASALDPRSIRRSEDAFVDGLIASAAGHGAAVIACRLGRAYVDVNRDPWELDPAMFHDATPARARAASPRVSAGLGVVPRLVGEGVAIYARKLAYAEAASRIAEVHRPYHAALQALVAEARARFGTAVLIDWHSMPSAAAQSEQANGRPRPDMVLGDRHGRACAPLLSAELRRALEGLGYRVSLNRPYAGGYTTELYGRPAAGVHACQVEIDRGLYLDEEAVAPSAGFSRLSADLETVFAGLAKIDWARRLA